MLEAAKGPVAGTEAVATANMEAFAAVVTGQGAPVSAVIRLPERDDGAGRYGYRLDLADGRRVEILMPGVPLAVVRDNRLTSVPLLYVDGLCWWWTSAVTIAASTAPTRR